MKLAQFTRQLKPSETLAISTTAKALRAQGRDIIDFGLGEPDFATPGNIMRAAEHAMAEGFTKYTPPAGLPALRRAIADKWRVLHLPAHRWSVWPSGQRAAPADLGGRSQLPARGGRGGPGTWGCVWR